MIDTLTANTHKRCKQLEKCEDIIDSVRVKLACGRDSSCIAHGMHRLKRYLDKIFSDKKQAAVEKDRDEMLDVIVRINNWCAQDLAENAHLCDSSGNYERTLNGLCEICRPYAIRAGKLKKYGGTE